MPLSIPASCVLPHSLTEQLAAVELQLASMGEDARRLACAGVAAWSAAGKGGSDDDRGSDNSSGGGGISRRGADGDPGPLANPGMQSVLQASAGTALETEQVDAVGSSVGAAAGNGDGEVRASAMAVAAGASQGPASVEAGL
jgi:hypothetical protein